MKHENVVNNKKYVQIFKKFQNIFYIENAGWRDYILVLQTDFFLFVKGDYGIGLLIIF